MKLSTLPERAQFARVRAGFLSHEEAAEEIGCGRTTVIRWETDEKAKIGPDYLLDAARAYQVRPEWLALKSDEDGYPFDQKAVSTPTSATRLEADIDELREWVVSLVDYLARYAPGAGAHIEAMMTQKPKSYLEKGMRKVLLDNLQEARRAGAEAPAAARPRAKRG